MLQDRYGNSLSTTSQAARDHYVAGVDAFLAANEGTEEALTAAIAADENFALAHVARGRHRQIIGDIPGMREDAAAARALADRQNAREQSHINAVVLLLEGKVPAGFAAIGEHLKEYPRDAVVAQPCAGVFGLIGFSGRPGREAEQLAYLTPLAPHYGDDWWFLGQFAFAQSEAGQISQADATIERALAGYPRAAHNAHVRAHVHYEAGDHADGLAYIADWRRDFGKRAMLHCHVSWHEALWSLETGNAARAWEIFEADVMPGGAWGPALNVLTDSASFLFRAELAGEPRREDIWRKVSELAASVFGKPGLSFADLHSALAHAVAGDSEHLAPLLQSPKGLAGDLVAPAGEAFRAFVAGDWNGCVAHLTPIMSAHERFGGSRAQRDLLEFTLLAALLHAGRAEEARRLLALRRPMNRGIHAVAGLDAAA